MTNVICLLVFDFKVIIFSYLFISLQKYSIYTNISEDFVHFPILFITNLYNFGTKSVQYCDMNLIPYINAS